MTEYTFDPETTGEDPEVAESMSILSMAKNTLANARETAETIIADANTEANQEAERILREANQEAKQLVADAQAESERLKRSAEAELEELESRLHELRVFESDYNEGLLNLVKMAASTLGAELIEPDEVQATEDEEAQEEFEDIEEDEASSTDVSPVDDAEDETTTV